MQRHSTQTPALYNRQAQRSHGRQTARSSGTLAMLGLGLVACVFTGITSLHVLTDLPGSEEKIVKGKNYLDPLDLTFADKLKKHRSLLTKGEEPIP